VMKIFLLFYMCHFAMGLTHCYKTTVFFTFIDPNGLQLLACRKYESVSWVEAVVAGEEGQREPKRPICHILSRSFRQLHLCGQNIVVRRRKLA